MKLLVLSNMYPSKEYNFYGIYVKNFIDSLEARDVDIEECVIRGRGTSFLDKVVKYFHYIFRASAKIIFSNYDAIYVHSASLALIPLSIFPFKINKPIIINAHGTDLLKDDFFSRAIARANKNVIARADLLIFPSTYYMEQVKVSFPKEKAFVSPSGGINRSIFKPGPISPKNSASKTFKIGYISRIDPYKGWETFIEVVLNLQSSFPELPLQAIIIGTGSEAEKLLKLIDDNSLSSTVKYMGQVQQSNLPDIYRELDAFIFPTRLNESLGLVGLEAMSCGTPVIASSIGGITEYIKDDFNGYLCPPSDTWSFCKKAILIYNASDAKKASLSQNAICTSQRFDSPTVTSALISKLEEIIKVCQ